MQEEKVTEYIIKCYDKDEHKLLMQASDMSCALWDISQELRTQRKHGRHSLFFSKLEEKFYAILSSNDVDIG